MANEHDEIEDGSDVLTDARKGPAPERKRLMAPVYIDVTQLPPDFSLGTVEEVLKIPGFDKDQKPIEKNFPFRGVKIEIVQLSVAEQFQAIDAAGPMASTAMIRVAQMKHAMRRFNGRAVDFSVEEQDTIFEALGMKGQAILAAGYARATQADVEAVQLMASQFRWA